MTAILIGELAQRTGVPVRTIRFYESIGLLPCPARGPNNYRKYTEDDVERLQMVASARGLGISIADIAEILAARDNGVAPCQRVLDVLARRIADIDRRVERLLGLQKSLLRIHAKGMTLPLDDVRGEGCVCKLIRNTPASQSEDATRSLYQ